MSFPVNEGETFSISYQHSVNQSLVTELFEINEGRIILSALEFGTFGAGMPTEIESGQTLVHLPGGGIRIEGFDRPMDRFVYLVGYTTQHTLHIGNKSIPLNTLAEAGQPIRFTLQ